MKPSTIRILLCAAVIVMLGGVVKNMSQAKSKPARPKQANATSSIVTEIANYGHWTLINPEPFFVPAPIAIACAPGPSTSPVNPHSNKFIKVFVNVTGHKAMTTEQTPKFPPGSVIVKEKLPKQDSAKPELLTVMVKRQPGFNPQGGDWDYAVFDGSGTKMQAHGQLAECQACHVTQKQSDYLFRTYLPDKSRSSQNSK